MCSLALPASQSSNPQQKGNAVFYVYADSKIIGQFEDWDRACDFAEEECDGMADVYIEESNPFYADPLNRSE